MTLPRFYTFRQTGALSELICNRPQRLGRYLIIEAASADQANAQALTLGVNFNTWNQVQELNATPKPTVYELAVKGFLKEIPPQPTPIVNGYNPWQELQEHLNLLTLGPIKAAQIERNYCLGYVICQQTKCFEIPSLFPYFAPPPPALGNLKLNIRKQLNCRIIQQHLRRERERLNEYLLTQTFVLRLLEEF